MTAWKTVLLIAGAYLGGFFGAILGSCLVVFVGLPRAIDEILKRVFE